MEKIEDYVNKVGYSERNPDTAIEPRLSLQWFLKMKHFADIALPPVMNDELKFYPPKYKNTYKNWLENIQDWCISRQLWWGHRIPAYYYNEEGDFVVAENREEALKLAQEKIRKLRMPTCVRTKTLLTPGSLHGCGPSRCSMASTIPATKRSSTTTPPATS